MRIIRKLNHLIFAAALLLASSSGHAALVNFEFTGDIDGWADTGNIWGLAFEGTITATGTFDDNAISGGGDGSVFFNDPGNSLTIIVGTQTYFATDDDNFGSGFPELVFTGGALTDFVFTTTQANHFFDSLLGFFDGEDDSFNQINGTWDFNSLTITPVPVPAALWLFGSGLLGLIGFAKRKAA